MQFWHCEAGNLASRTGPANSKGFLNLLRNGFCTRQDAALKAQRTEKKWYHLSLISSTCAPRRKR